MSGKEKIMHFLGWVPFKIGEWSFPVLEPVLGFLDNWDLDVKKYYIQALKGLETDKTAIALLNLNMVVSLKPNHFLAHVQRGRIYLKEKRFRLASEELLKASRISRYRFVHYDLFREYSQSVNQESEGASLPNHFNHFPNKAFQKAEDHMKREFDGDDAQSSDSFSGILSRLEGEDSLELDEDFARAEEEKELFDSLGPITLQEIEDTDWDQLSRKLSF